METQHEERASLYSGRLQDQLLFVKDGSDLVLTLMKHYQITDGF